MKLHRLLWVAAWTSSAALLGCAGDGEGLKRDLDAVTRQVAELRADNAAMQERIDALEATGPAATVERELPPGEERPELSVVRLEPDEAVPSQSVAAAEPSLAPAPSDEDTNTVIVGRGDKVESWDRQGGGGR